MYHTSWCRPRARPSGPWKVSLSASSTSKYQQCPQFSLNTWIFSCLSKVFRHIFSPERVQKGGCDLWSFWNFCSGVEYLKNVHIIHSKSIYQAMGSLIMKKELRLQLKFITNIDIMSYMYVMCCYMHTICLPKCVGKLFLRPW